ncbi:MAG: SDR family NAD(P)-dependent oxidoreductase [Candidatus Hydrogenedentes bacterium]|nr:SDR family NAD(P)-dependent oxidoreductase [Candidatus Hydrogenedentota bacterium]
MELQGKTFIVTGGGSGLGEGAARVFAQAGANLVIADVNEGNGRAVADALGAQARFAMCNVTEEAQVRATVAAALETFGALHGAVNCAGIGAAQRVCSKAGPHPLDLFKIVIEINLVGTFNVIRLAADAMLKLEPDRNGERGVFINTASVAAFDGQIGQAAYAASKGGVVSMTLPAAREFARSGIRVVTIAPGLFDTPMFDQLPPEAKQALAASIPFPSRLGRPDEFGALARHVVENAMLNGETVRLDGALRMPPK